MPERKAQILIVDDHPALRYALARMIEHEPDLEVCGQADGVTQAFRLMASMSPDLVLVDISLRDGHGLDLIKDLRAGKTPPRILVVSNHDEASYAERALHAGAHGYVTKSAAPAEIVQAIRKVLEGDVYVSRQTAMRLLGDMVGSRPQPGKSPEQILSDRELQVFEFLGQGLNSKEIGERLMLTSKTIDSHRENIKDKLGINSGNELIVRAVLWVHHR